MNEQQRQAVERLEYMVGAPEECWVAAPQEEAVWGVVVRREDLSTLLALLDRPTTCETELQGPFCPKCSGAQSKFARDALVERRRHVEVEGWTPEHDDIHGNGALAAAAACYAIKASLAINDYRFGLGYPPPWWPGWAIKWWKPKDRRSDLIRSAALIIAEGDRLDRLSAPVLS